MKRIFTIISLGLFLCSATLISGINEVVNAVKSGNAAQVAKYFDNTIEISMPDKSNSYSKSQAEMVLKDFFNTHEVRSFEILHKGEKAGSQYCIGTLVTKNGSFRTTIYLKQKGDKQLLQEISFENK